MKSMYSNKQPVFSVDFKDQMSLREWRDYDGSLTDKLSDLTGSVHVELVYQQWNKKTWWDNYCLQIKDDQVFLREIIMTSRGKEYWYARTIIPQKCYDLHPLFFNRLGQESIKNLIFGESKVRRISKICYQVDSNCLEFHWVKKYIKGVNGILWVRLAEYCLLGQQSFYLVEILLPELEHL